jgi:hypothetical protein
LPDTRPRRGRLSLLLLLCICLLMPVAVAFPAAPVLAAPVDAAFRQGLSAYNSGDIAKAMKIWLPLAQAEDAAAQAGIGFM